MNLESQAKYFNTIIDYLSQRDIEQPTEASFDVLVLCGNTSLRTAEAAKAFFQNGIAKTLVIAGGFGHASPPLFDNVNHHPSYNHIPTEERSEAEVLLDLMNHGESTPLTKVFLDIHSTHCGENASLALKVCRENNVPARSVLIMQDPVMQRRTHMSFVRHWKDTQATLISFAYLKPFLTVTNNQLAFARNDQAYCAMERYIPLVFGEIHRLRNNAEGYGPLGLNFIDHVDIPEKVDDAFAQLEQAFPEEVAMRKAT